jgi:hypothetical protein
MRITGVDLPPPSDGDLDVAYENKDLQSKTA